MFRLKINENYCKSCSLCIKYCPKDVLEVGQNVNTKGYRYVVAKHPENCIGCKSCALICPDAAIEIFKEQA